MSYQKSGLFQWLVVSKSMMGSVKEVLFDLVHEVAIGEMKCLSTEVCSVRQVVLHALCQIVLGSLPVELQQQPLPLSWPRLTRILSHCQRRSESLYLTDDQVLVLQESSGHLGFAQRQVLVEEPPVPEEIGGQLAEELLARSVQRQLMEAGSALEEVHHIEGGQPPAALQP